MQSERWAPVYCRTTGNAIATHSHYEQGSATGALGL